MNTLELKLRQLIKEKLEDKTLEVINVFFHRKDSMRIYFNKKEGSD